MTGSVQSEPWGLAKREFGAAFPAPGGLFPDWQAEAVGSKGSFWGSLSASTLSPAGGCQKPVWAPLSPVAPGVPQAGVL